MYLSQRCAVLITAGAVAQHTLCATLSPLPCYQFRANCAVTLANTRRLVCKTLVTGATELGRAVRIGAVVSAPSRLISRAAGVYRFSAHSPIRIWSPDFVRPRIIVACEKCAQGCRTTSCEKVYKTSHKKLPKIFVHASHRQLVRSCTKLFSGSFVLLTTSCEKLYKAYRPKGCRRK